MCENEYFESESEECKKCILYEGCLERNKIPTTRRIGMPKEEMKEKYKI